MIVTLIPLRAVPHRSWHDQLAPQRQLEQRLRPSIYLGGLSEQGAGAVRSGLNGGQTRERLDDRIVDRLVREWPFSPIRSSRHKQVGLLRGDHPHRYQDARQRRAGNSE